MSDPFLESNEEVYAPLPIMNFSPEFIEKYTINHASQGNEDKNLAFDLVGRLAFSPKYKKHFAVGDRFPQSAAEAYQNVKRGEANYLRQDLSIFGRIDAGEVVDDASIIKSLSNVRKPSYLETFGRTTLRTGAQFGGFMTGAAAGHNAAALTGVGYPYAVIPFSLIGGLAGLAASDKIASDGNKIIFGDHVPVLPSARAKNESMKTLGTAPWLFAPHLSTGKSYQLVGSNVVENVAGLIKEKLALFKKDLNPKDLEKYAELVKKYGFKTQPTKTITGKAQVFAGPVYGKDGKIVTPAKDYGLGDGVVAGDFSMVSEELVSPFINRLNFAVERFLSNIGTQARGTGTKEFGPSVFGKKLNVGATAFTAADTVALGAAGFGTFTAEQMSPGDVPLRLFNEIAAGVGTELLLIKSLPMLFTKGQAFMKEGVQKTISEGGTIRRQSAGMKKIIKLLKENGEDPNKVLELLQENALTKHFNKQKQVVLPVLEKQADEIQRKLSTAADPAEVTALNRQLTEIRGEISDLQEFNPTVGMITMSPTLLTIENNLVRSGSKALGTSKASQADKALNGLRRYIQILESTGDQGLLKEAAKIRKEHLENLISLNLATNISNMAEAVAKVEGPNVSPAFMGKKLFEIIDKTNIAFRQAESQLWTKSRASGIIINKFYKKENENFDLNNLTLDSETGENIPNFLYVYLDEVDKLGKSDGSVTYLRKKLGELSLDLDDALMRFGVNKSRVAEKSVNDVVIPTNLANSNAKLAELEPSAQFYEELDNVLKENSSAARLIKNSNLIETLKQDPAFFKYTKKELKKVQKEYDDFLKKKIDELNQITIKDNPITKMSAAEKIAEAERITKEIKGERPVQYSTINEENILTLLEPNTQFSQDIISAIDRRILFLDDPKNKIVDPEIEKSKLEKLKEVIASGKTKKFGPFDNITPKLLNDYDNQLIESQRLNFLEKIVNQKLGGRTSQYLGSGPGSEKQKYLDLLKFIKEKRKNIELNQAHEAKKLDVLRQEPDPGKVLEPEYDVKTLFAIRSLALSKHRELANDPGARNARRVLKRIANAVFDDLEGFSSVNGISNAMFSDYNSAIAFSKAMNDVSTRTFMGEILKTNRLGGQSIHFEELAEKFNQGNASAVTLRTKQLTDLSSFMQDKLKPLMDEQEFSQLMSEHRSLHQTLDDVLRLTTKKIIKTGRDTTGENLTVKDVDPVKLANLKKEWEDSGLFNILPELKQSFDEPEELLKNINYLKDSNSAYNETLKNNIMFSKVTNIENPAVALSKAISGDNPTEDLNNIIKIVKEASQENNIPIEDLNQALMSSVINHAMINSGGYYFKAGPMYKTLFEPMKKALGEVDKKMLETIAKKDFASDELLLKLETQKLQQLKYKPSSPSLMEFMISNKVVTQQESDRIKQLLEKMAQFEGAANAGAISDELLDETGALLDLTLRISGSFLGTRAQQLFPGTNQAGSLIAASAGSKFMRRVFERMPNVARLDVMTTVMKDPDLFRTLMGKPGNYEGGIEGYSNLLETLLSSAGLLVQKPAVFIGQQVLEEEPEVKVESNQTEDQVSSLNLPQLPVSQTPPPELISPSLSIGSPITPITGQGTNVNQNQRAKLAAAFPFDITSDVDRMKQAGIGSLMG